MKLSRLTPVLFFGTIWGLSEVLLGNYLYANEIKTAAVYLNVIAIVLLSVSRYYVSFTGAAFLIGTIAMLFKIFHSPFFACHMLAIAMFAAGFEISAGLFLRKNASSLIRQTLTGATAVYLGFAIFTVVITFVFRYQYWIVDGAPNMVKITHYLLFAGTVVAAAAAVLTPLSMRITGKMNQAVLPKLTLKPLYINLIVVLVSMTLWLVV